MFQFAQLEEDVVVNFIAGKPLIRSGDTKGTGKSLHSPFKFHQPPQAQTSIVYKYVCIDAFHDNFDLFEISAAPYTQIYLALRKCYQIIFW